MSSLASKRPRLAFGLAAALLAGWLAIPARAADPVVAERVMKLTRGTKWTQIAAIKIAFKTFHPQGMVRIGEDFYVSSVDIQKATTRYPEPRDGYDRDTGAGVGHLFKIGPDGKLLGDLTLGEGTVFHPGGIDYDGEFIWVPAAEYRPNSQAIIYKVDPKTMKAAEVFRFKDHVGGVVHDTDDNSLHGVSWGSRRLYAWPLGADGKVANADADPAKLRVLNADQYIDYQDCHYLGGHRMLCSGLNTYKAAPDAKPFYLGGFDVVDLKDNRPVWQVPIELWSPSGLPMTYNPFFVEASQAGLRAYFMPDDDTSTLFVYDAAIN